MHEVIRKGQQKNIVLQQEEKNGIEYFTFPSFTDSHLVEHLFSTRVGGVSEGIYASMNLSYTRGDEKEKVDENFKRIGQLLGRDVSEFVLSKQTHTKNIRRVTKEDAGKGIVKPLDYEDVDGLLTNERGVVLTTVYADCVPLYFLDTKKKVIGLAHSGWRGTVLKIGKEMVEQMKAHFDCNPKDIITGIGPSICVDCYEVSSDVAEEIKNAFPEVSDKLVIAKGNGKYQLDLWQANVEVMLEAGIPRENITITDVCTCCNPEYLFSHRASEGKRGNLGAFLCLKK